MTTQPQPEALRLADALLEPVVLDKHAMQAAAELRRLHAECEALLSCVEQWRDLYRRAFSEACWATDSSNLFVIASEARALDAARAAKEQA